MGVVQENLNSGPGSVAMCQHMVDKYVPCADGVPLKLVLFGDQGTFERMVQARRTASGRATASQRFLGLEPAGQDFHKRGIYNQVGCHLIYQ